MYPCSALRRSGSSLVLASGLGNGPRPRSFTSSVTYLFHQKRHAALVCTRCFFHLLAWLGLTRHRINSPDRDHGGYEGELLGTGCVTVWSPHGRDLAHISRIESPNHCHYNNRLFVIFSVDLRRYHCSDQISGTMIILTAHGRSLQRILNSITWQNLIFNLRSFIHP